ISERCGRLPDYLVACIGGGSNAMGLFHAFLNDSEVKMIGVEAGGRGYALGENAGRFLGEGGGRGGRLEGKGRYVLQDDCGQIALTHSVSAGLDYASVGPEHAHLHEQGRAEYVSANDGEALEAFQFLAKMEGIIPALESSHAVAHVMKLAPRLSK